MRQNRWPKSIYNIGDEPDPRTTLANERTALAGIRTALALVATSMAITALLGLFDNTDILLKLLAAVLALAGGTLAITSLMHWINVEKALRQKKPLPSPNGLVTISLFIGIIGIITIIGIISS